MQKAGLLLHSGLISASTGVKAASQIQRHSIFEGNEG